MLFPSQLHNGMGFSIWDEQSEVGDGRAMGNIPGLELTLPISVAMP